MNLEIDCNYIDSRPLESAVIGCMVINPDCIPEVIELVGPDDFTDFVFRRWFEGICNLWRACEVIDGLLVRTKLNIQGKELNLFINALYSVPLSANALQYAKELRNKSDNRKLLRDIEAVAEGVKDAALSTEEKKALFEQVAFQIRGAKSGGGAVPIRDFVVDAINWLEKTDSSGLKTDFFELDDKLMGLAKQQLIIIAGRPSMGKAQPLSAKVLTPQGFVKMKDLGCGDKVFAADGTETSIIGIYPQGKRKVYEVVMSDGSKTRCDAEHLWSVNARNKRKEGKNEDEIKTAKELMANLKTANRRNWRIQRCKPIQFSTVRQPLAPFLVGYYLGDGWSHKCAAFVLIDKNIRTRIRRLLPSTDRLKKAGKISYRVIRKKRNNKPTTFYRELMYLGLADKRSYEKFVPDVYLYGDIEQRRQLLEGLLASDGYKINEKWYEYSTTSKRLAEQIYFVVRSLGGHCNFITRIGRYKKNGDYINCRKYYRLFLSLNDVRPHYIESIKFAGEEECQCIEISHPSGLYITDDFIVTHNSALALNIAANIVQDGHSGIFFSLEMSGSLLAQRMLASYTGIGLYHLKKQAKDNPAHYEAANQIGNLNLYIDDSSGLTPTELSARILRARKLFNIEFAVIDYLQLVYLKGFRESRQQEITKIVAEIKAAAKRADIPIILVSQLNRAPEQRQNHRPLMSDLRESGSIEQDADAVLLIHRDDYYRKGDEPKDGKATVIIAKNRQGETGEVDLLFVPELFTFKNLTKDKF